MSVLDFTPDKAPLPAPDKNGAALDLLFQMLQEREGKAPNLMIHEFPLVAAARHTINADFEPDRWVVYFRPITDGVLRIYPGDYVPPVGAVEIATGQVITLAHKNERISFHNSSAAVNLGAVFAVAIGGGSEFSVTSWGGT